MAFPQLTKDSMRDPSVSTLGREANGHSLLAASGRFDGGPRGSCNGNRRA